MSKIRQDAQLHWSKPSQTHTHAISSWKALFAFTRKHHLTCLLPAILLSLVAGLLQPIMALLLGRVFNSFSDYAAGKSEPSKFTRETKESSYAILAVGICTFVIKGGMFILWLQFGETQARCMRNALFKTLLDKDLEWFELHPAGVGTLLTRAQTQIREAQLAVSQPLGLSIAYITQASVALALAFRTNWKLTLVILASLPLICIGIVLIARNTQRNTEFHNEQLTQASKVVFQALTNVVTIKCLNIQADEERKYRQSVGKAAAFYVKIALANALQSGFLRFMANSIFVQGFWYGGSQVHSGATTAGKVITTFWCCIIAMTSFDDILPQFIVLEKGRAAAAALAAMSTSVRRREPHITKSDGLSPQFCEGEIVMESVSFSYPSNPCHLVLRECDFCFPAGQTTFIIGQSGSGKSTLGHLLLRFYKPNHGRICMDAVGVQDFDTSWLRSNITLVQQQCYLFSETIFTNIALGRADHHQVTHQEVHQCLKVASLETAIADLPDGVLTKVGVGGSSLSGGQKQRVALARAGLRDTPVLILDEATSALDYTTRTTVMNAIREWRAGRTTIIITHDLEQIKDEDYVYVLEDGVIVRQGRRENIADVLKRMTVYDKWSRKDENAVDATTSMIPLQNLKLSTRKAALAAEAVAHTGLDTEIPHTGNSTGGISRKLKESILSGTEAAVKNLRRQSIARAKIMYATMPPSPFPFDILSHEPSQERATQHASTYRVPLSATNPGISKRSSKQLPIPPLMLEFQDRAKHPVVSSNQVSEKKELDLSIIAILRTVLPTLKSRQRMTGVFAIIAILGHAGVPPAFSFMLARVLSTFYMSSGYKQKLLIYSLSILAITVIDGLCCFFKACLLESIAQSWVDGLRIRAFKRTLQQPKGWFDQETVELSTIVAALDRHAEEIKDIVGKYAAQILIVAIMVAVATTWSFMVCWKITLVSVACTPIIYLATKTFESISSRWEVRTNTKYETVGTIFVEAFADIKTVRALTLESYFHAKYKSAVEDAFAAGTRRARYCGFFYGLSESSINFMIALMFWYGARLAKDQEWPVKPILTVFALILFCASSATSMLSCIPQMSSARDTASRLLELTREPVSSHEGEGDIQLDVDDVATLTGPIHFINLTFYYPTRPRVPALRYLNLTIPSGKYTAIVGRSGSGKSTITSLLLGLYPPTADELAMSPSDYYRGPPSLTLSGRDIRSLDLATLRSMIAVVDQTPVLLPGTVRENITYGLPADSPLKLATNIEGAAQMAGIHEFVQSLPQGYATIIGDGGIGMSGGQAQRIVVARALVRNPRILILDEATSALDRENAAIIQKSVLRLIKERKGTLTVIVVTHSRDMMKFADQIVMMENGNAIEQGTYTELLRARGKFWEMLTGDASS